MSDDVEKISKWAANYWHDAGLKYEKENEQELKDKTDFGDDAPTHYPPGIGLYFAS